MQLAGVDVVRADQCQFGLITKGRTRGERSIAKKPTKFISNSREMLECLGRTCQGGHDHQPLEGGRCAEAAFYPVGLIKAFLKGIGNTAKAAEHRDEALKEERLKIAAMVYATQSKQEQSIDRGKVLGKTKIQDSKGGHRDVELHSDNFRTKYFDEYTGEELPEHLVREAMIEEMTYFFPPTPSGQPPSIKSTSPMTRQPL